MSDVKRFAENLLSSKTSEAQNLMKVLKEEYGIEAGAGEVSVLNKSKVPISRRERCKREREAKKKQKRG